VEEHSKILSVGNWIEVVKYGYRCKNVVMAVKDIENSYVGEMKRDQVMHVSSKDKLFDKY